MFDWFHHAEGLRVFNYQGLSDPYDEAFGERVRRFAEFYTGEDSEAPNYDPQHRVIRSMFTGSRGPLLRDATALDWAGDPIEVEGRFKPRHGERNYEEMLAHFEDYIDIVGDAPQNLSATSLAFNAYALTGESKYRDWLLEYVDAWRQWTAANGGIIPSKIGLDGRIGGPQGKWYGGVYGWGFTVVVPQNGQLSNRNTHYRGLTGFANAFLLTGDVSYLDVWAGMIDAVNGNAKEVDGRTRYPRMYGDEGWYAYVGSPYSAGAHEIYYWTLREEDGKRVGRGGGRFYDQGEPQRTERIMRHNLGWVKNRLEAMRRDPTTPQTRLSDDPMVYNPVMVGSLIQLMLGGLSPGSELIAAPLHCQVRYFDPSRRRAGIAEDVAALVEVMDTDGIVLRLINTNREEARTVVVQAGAYAEHQFLTVATGDEEKGVDGSSLVVKLAPGAGVRLKLAMRRYANQPTFTFPWDRQEHK